MKNKIAALALLVTSIASSAETFNSASTYDGSVGWLCLTTQFVHLGDKFIISDYLHDRFVYRSNKKGSPWKSSSIKYHQAHNIELDKRGNFVFPDIGGQRLVVARCLDASCVVRYVTPPGRLFTRPHAIAIGDDGSIYVVDPDALYRISKDYAKVDEWKVPGLGYARSIKFINGKLYIANSNKGNIIAIEDFDARKFVTYDTPLHKKDGDAGSISTTGFIINDIAYFKGFYYASNFFSPAWVKNADTNTMRIVRWKTWNEFTEGKVEDVSYLIPKDLVPYFISVDGGEMLITAFDDVHTCGPGSKAFTISPSNKRQSS